MKSRLVKTKFAAKLAKTQVCNRSSAFVFNLIGTVKISKFVTELNGSGYLKMKVKIWMLAVVVSNSARSWK